MKKIYSIQIEVESEVMTQNTMQLLIEKINELINRVNQHETDILELNSR